MNLHDKTLKLVETSEIPLTHIARDCNVSYRWLMTFKSGKAPGAAVNKVQRVYDYLTKSEAA